MSRWRRAIGPPDWIIAGVMVCALAVVIGAAYGAAVWTIGAAWKPVLPRQSAGGGFAGVAVRGADGSIAFDLALSWGAVELLDSLGSPPEDTMLVRYWVDESTRAKPWELWSASKRVESLRFIADGQSARATGGPLTPREELQILKQIQREHPESLPPLLRSSSGLSASGTIRVGARHNTMRAAATLIAVALFLWGAQRIIRSELRYRRWFLARCAKCGYALGGIRGDRCPECGTQWWPYGDAG